MKLCTPAIVYLVLAVIGLVLNFMKFSLFSGIVHIVFVFIWTFVLNWICSKGYSWVSWLLVILPYVFIALVVLIAAEFSVLLKSQPQLAIIAPV
jgi:hypothetical protein